MLSFSIERPYALLFMLCFVPVIAVMVFKYVRLSRALPSFCPEDGVVSGRRALRHSFFSGLFLRFVAWVAGCLALAGISWGTKQVPVQKSGGAVCLVFDISYSMNAADVRGMSRLDAVRKYVGALLPRMDGVSVSAVIAKGDGFVALPLTEDFAAVYSLVDSLSPHLMTASGSSIGRGIECALSSFPRNMAQANMIWVFTDGDETDDSMYPALVDAGRFRIPVTLVGFGSEDGTRVIAGDGKTEVVTYLMASRMRSIAEEISKEARKSFHSQGLVRYVDADSKGSVTVLLDQLSPSSELCAFEFRPVERHVLLIFVSLISFVLSFVMGELDVAGLRRKARASVSMVAVLPFFLSSCSDARSLILEGSWFHYSGKFREATADFLTAAMETEKDDASHPYALFGLASTYISLEEYDAALEKLDDALEQIGSDGEGKLRGAIFYNEGVVLGRKGEFDSAREMFKKSVVADPTNMDARINLELCIRRESLNNTRSGASEMKGVSESRGEPSPLERSLFNLIREGEQNRWKKMESKEADDGGIDY